MEGGTFSKPGDMRQMPLIGLSTGVCMGLFVYGLSNALGFQILMNGQDVTGSVCIVAAIVFGMIGLILGRLSKTNAEWQIRANTIRLTMRKQGDSSSHKLKTQRIQTIGTVATNVAHEVKQPLGVIRETAQHLQHGASPEAREACTSIAAEVERLNRYVDQLVQFGQPLRTSMTQVNLFSSVDSVLNLAQEALSAGGVTVEVMMPAELPMPKADPDLVEAVLLAFVNNAIEAMGGGGRLVIRGNSSDNLVYVEVADSGPGIPHNSEARVFEPFYTTKETAAGLGLATAVRIAEIHRGMVRIIPQAGAGKNDSGACLRLLLPRGGRNVDFGPSPEEQPMDEQPA